MGLGCWQSCPTELSHPNQEPFTWEEAQNTDLSKMPVLGKVQEQHLEKEPKVPAFLVSRRGHVLGGVNVPSVLCWIAMIGGSENTQKRSAITPCLLL